MKCNTRELALLSDQSCTIEGRLNYKKIFLGSYRHQAVFKERWFRLINNYLFYFKISEMGKFDSKSPAGVFVMENSSIQMEHGQSIPFSFSISFIDEADKRHIFAARTEDSVVQWVIKLRECSYEYLRSRLHTLQSKIYAVTGKDPLLLVPRNEGACLWAPSVPFSTVPACTVNTSSFSCHLHTNGAFTLERSKSDVQTHKHIHHARSKKTKFYVEEHKSSTNNESILTGQFNLERSRTTAQLQGSTNSIDKSIFDNRPQHSRRAPHPPVRLRPSPGVRRAEMLQEIIALGENSNSSNSLSALSILDDAPVPPRRKVSPKTTEPSNNDQQTTNASDDLIKF